MRGETDRMVDRGSVRGAAVDLAVRVCRPVPPPDPSGAPLFGALTQASAAVIVVVREDGWSPMSDAFEATLGYAGPPDQPLIDLVHPDDQSIARAIYRNCRAGQTPAAAVDLRIAAADNTWRTMEVVARPIDQGHPAPADAAPLAADTAADTADATGDGAARGSTAHDGGGAGPDPGPRTVAFFGTDVTRQRQTERTVRLEQHRLASLVATMGDGLLLLDEGDRISLANQAAYRLLDLVDPGAGEGIADWAAFVGELESRVAVPPDKLARLRTRSAHAVIGEEIDFVDGRVLEFDFVPVQPEDRRAGSLGTVVHLRDVTTRVAARRGLEERSRGLEERNRALAEAGALNNQFVASVSHELRGPLSSVVAFSHLLGDATVGELSEDQRMYLAVIDRNASRLLRIIEDLLLLSRLEARTLQLKLARARLADILAAAVAERTPAARTANVTLELSTTAGPDVVCDDTRIHQVVDNLISNAVKFTPAGGHVRVRASATGDEWRVEIADSGVGIPAGDLPRLFNAFFRGSNVAPSSVAAQVAGPYVAGAHRGTHATPGTGLGLVVCRAIVELHGGTITVASTEGVGTTVTLSLPTRPARTGGSS